MTINRLRLLFCIVLQVQNWTFKNDKKRFTTQNTKERYKLKINAQIDKYKVENY
jgi:hypothetical protein